MSSKKEIPQITVERRQQLGSRYAARLRTTGKLPAVIYGHKQDPIHVVVDYKEIHTHLHNNAHLINVQLDGKTESVLIRDVQWDHLGSTLIHVDLTRVDLTERVTVEVPLKVVGDAPGLKSEGAILEQPITQLEIQALVTEIPQEIAVDVSSLNAGDTITVADLKLPANVTTTTLEPDTIIVSISVVEEQPETMVDPDAPAEPAVIGKKADEEEDAEAAKK